MGKKNLNIKNIQGMNDIIPSENAPYFLQSKNWRYIDDLFKKNTDSYNYKYIETPEVEMLELFARSAGESSDIVSKEMYSWEQGKYNLCLRPEGSASVCRAVIQNKLMNRQNYLKIWYRLPMFRHERPQHGRYRRHIQYGIEFLGEESYLADAEVIKFLVDFYNQCGITDFKIHLNSVGDDNCRPQYREKIIEKVKPNLNEYCDDCKRRFETNPMRILDCKEKKCQELNQNIPPITENLCDDCKTHFEGVKESLDLLGIEYVLNPNLVRGLDYYTRTVFEVMLDKAEGPIGTLSGGGRYDKLYGSMGKLEIPAVGFGMGAERLLLIMEKQKEEPVPENKPFVFAAYYDIPQRKKAFKIISKLRSLGIPSEMELTKRKLKKQLSQADSLNAEYCIIIGEEEVENSIVSIKNLKTGEQFEVQEEKVSDFIKDIYYK